MLLPALLAAAVNWAEAPPVPGGCAAPAAEHPGEPGCYLAAEIEVSQPPPALWWSVYELPDLATARAEARGRRWSAVTASHGRAWLHVLESRPLAARPPLLRAAVGPIQAPAGEVLIARFLESTFPPGMRTRVHSHAGPEAFYVVDGEQCVESPGVQRKLGPGDTLVVPPGPHVQAAAKGRRNITLLLVPKGAPWMSLEAAWTPSQYCAD